MRRSDVNYKLSAAAFYQRLWIIYVGTVNFSVFRRRRIAFSPFSSYNRIKDVLKEKTMKTKEELTALREEVEALGEKLAELSEDELAEVSGGRIPLNDTVELNNISGWPGVLPRPETK